MNEYKLEVKHAYVVKETYKVEFQKVVNASPPSVEGEFKAPYIATIEMPLGEEKVKVTTNGSLFNVESQKYDSSKAQRLKNLGKVVGKLLSTEIKSIFGNHNSYVTYSGLPTDIDATIENAKNNYNAAFGAYTNDLQVEPQTTIRTRRDTISWQDGPIDLCRVQKVRHLEDRI